MYSQNDLEAFFKDRYDEAYEAFIQSADYALYQQKDKTETAITELAAPEHTDLLEGYFSSLDMLNSLLERFLYKRGFSDCLKYLKIIDSLS